MRPEGSALAVALANGLGAQDGTSPTLKGRVYSIIIVVKGIACRHKEQQRVKGAGSTHDMIC